MKKLLAVLVVLGSMLFIPSLPAHAATTTLSAPLVIQNQSNVTINYNSASFTQTGSGPILKLLNDTNVTIENVNLAGQGGNGSSATEGDYGIVFEGDTNLTLSGVSVSNVQGDFLYFSPPYDVPSTDSLNKNITVTNSTFTNAGYHGVTVESVNGLNINHDTFTNIGVDAFDFEYDIYSTGFNPDGSPYWAAEDNITIADNTFTNWHGDWFSSIQGQTPGVQEQNVIVTGNTLIGNAPLFEVVGTDFTKTQARSYNIGLTITNNTLEGYALPVRGGSITQQYPGEGAMSFQSVVGLDIENNTFPMFNGTCTPYVYFCDTPYMAALYLQQTEFTAVRNNNFSGALGTINPASSNYGAFFSESGNTQ